MIHTRSGQRVRETITPEFLDVEAPGWQGARRAHTRRHETDEQRSQPGWIVFLLTLLWMLLGAIACSDKSTDIKKTDAQPPTADVGFFEGPKTTKIVDARRVEAWIPWDLSPAKEGSLDRGIQDAAPGQ